MARPHSVDAISGLSPTEVEDAIAASGGARWRGCFFPRRGILHIKVRKARGRWITRSTGLRDTPENRLQARAMLDNIRSRAVTAESKPRSKSNGRNTAFKRRRGHACEVCGWTPRPPLRLTATNAHHVRPREEGGDDSDENRVILCPNHHAVAHALHRERPSTTREDLIARIRAWEAEPGSLRASG